MMDLPIYLDYNATTPVAPEVLQEMLPYFGESFGNPSSSHIFGRISREALSKARERLASLINARPEEIVFTSGGTESNNMVIKGMLKGKDPRDVHIISCEIEHPSILNPLLDLMGKGVRVTLLPVDGDGVVDPDQVRRAIRHDTKLVTIMLANNETGTIQPIKEIKETLSGYDIPLHTDAAQAIGKIPVDVNELGCDLMSMAGHKFYAPKGVGALFIRSGLQIDPLMQGGGQEGGLRPGTESVPLLVGLGMAALIAAEGIQKKEPDRLRSLRDEFYQRLSSAIPHITLNGKGALRLPNTLNVSFPGKLGQDLLEKASKVFVASTGAACHDRSLSISHVLSAMGLSKERAMGAIRISLGRYTQEEEVVRASNALIEAFRA